MKKKSDEQLKRGRDEVLRTLFRKLYKEGAAEISYTMENVLEAIKEVQNGLPEYVERNPYDVRYQYTSGRSDWPADLAALGPWMIEGRGKGKYALVKLKAASSLDVPKNLVAIAVPDATPEIVLEYAGADEQGVLAKIRYNRLLDIFLQITCYHLQNHWRTSIKGRGQCEIDDLYVAINTMGKQFVIPIEAKCASETISKTQIVQNIAFARARYAKLIMRPVGVQELADGSLILMEFNPASHPDEVGIKDMRRYKLVPFVEVPSEQQDQID
jgi:hypothetical protein